VPKNDYFHALNIFANKSYCQLNSANGKQVYGKYAIFVCLNPKKQ